MSDQHLTIRVAQPQDAYTLRALAELDSQRPLGGRVLIVEHEEVALAAVSVETGAVTADPFRRTAEAVRLLRVRRDQITGQSSEVARLPRLFAPHPAR